MRSLYVGALGRKIACSVTTGTRNETLAIRILRHREDTEDKVVTISDINGGHVSDSTRKIPAYNSPFDMSHTYVTVR